MRWCKNCLEPDTRPGQVFDESGICTPCQYALNKVPVDWDARKREIKEIAEWAKANRTGKYDCVLGVSGGKDSVRLAYFLRELGLNPLLVCATYIPQQMTDLGAYNLANIIECGFDLETINVAPDTCRKMMQFAFKKFGNWAKATEFFLITSMPRMAITHGIPLACGGENPFVTSGSECGSTDGDATNFAMLNTIGGGDLSHFIDEGFTENDLHFYSVPSVDQMQANKIRFIYLGYYIDDWGVTPNAKFSIDKGLKCRDGFGADPANTGSLHPYACLDEDFIFVHQYLKYLKFGFSFATQQLSHDIREMEEGSVKREEAIELVKKYDGKCSEHYLERVRDFLEMSREDFDETLEKFRNDDVWQKDNHGNWIHRQPIE
ncbi:MAG: N-acetyl sugar amidotransferase [Magnetovibrio sp.]|nr:N-acetyl sugar amidotransferase [Magnetovibrio sp.]